jgi:hypothetical protein
MKPEELQPFVEISQCEKGYFHVKYLGIPLHHDRLKREDLHHLIENILKRVTRWRGKLLSAAAKRVLDNLVYLAYLYTYYPSNSLNGL